MIPRMSNFTLGQFEFATDDFFSEDPSQDQPPVFRTDISGLLRKPL
jgi:hypothetical protein